MLTGQPAIEIGFSGAYGFDRLEKTIKTLQPLLSLVEPAVIVIDLSRLVHISPTSLALLLATMKRVEADGLLAPGTRIITPASPPVARYIERMNLIRQLVGGEVAEGFTRREPEGFRPVERFASGDDYWTMAGSLTDAVAERCRVDKGGKSAIRVCLDEICENVVHHADTELGGFAAAQGWPRKNREFEIAIVDLGVGIRSSLTKNPDYAHITDDATAIATALQPRVTATPERNGGIGLFVTSMLLAINGGILLVRSGTGAVFQGAKNTTESREVAMPGTIVALRAKMDRPLDINSVYAELDKAEQAADLKEMPADADHREDDPQAR